MPEYGVGVIFFANVTYAKASKANLDALDKLVVDAQLKPRQLPASQVLKDRQNELLKLLPDWENAAESGIFAENFFLDVPLDLRKSESNELFSKVGKIISVGALIPENQLSGYFIVEGEKANLRISLGLTPENPSLIQLYQIQEINK